MFTGKVLFPDYKLLAALASETIKVSDEKISIKDEVFFVENLSFCVKICMMA